MGREGGGSVPGGEKRSKIKRFCSFKSSLDGLIRLLALPLLLQGGKREDGAGG